MPKTKFSVYRTNKDARFTMSYICECGEPVIGYSDDEKGLFVGRCGNGHETSVMAS